MMRVRQNDVFGEHLEPSRMPEDYQTGEYGAIALEIFDEFTKVYVSFKLEKGKKNVLII